jgi:hypothetical protein
MSGRGWIIWTVGVLTYIFTVMQLLPEQSANQAAELVFLGWTLTSLFEPALIASEARIGGFRGVVPPGRYCGPP